MTKQELGLSVFVCHLQATLPETKPGQQAKKPLVRSGPSPEAEFLPGIQEALCSTPST